MRRVLGAVVCGLMLVAIAAGCSSSSGMTYEMNERITNAQVVSKHPPDANYIVDPPDSLRIEFLSEPTLTREVQVRQDGTVTLPYLEDIKVAGLTTIQIREKLEDLYARYYREPKILITVSAFRSKRVFIYGEVGRQGAIPYTGYMTVSDLIGEVGGVTQRAAFRRIKVIRGDPQRPELYTVDFYRLAYLGDTLQDVSLAENDVVRVPPTVLAWIGYQIDQLLFPFRGVIGAAATYQTMRGLGD